MTVTDCATKAAQGWIYDADCPPAQTATNTFRREVNIGTGDFDINQRIDFLSGSGFDVFAGYIAVSDAQGGIIALAGPADPSSGFAGIKRLTITDGQCNNYAGDKDTYGEYSKYADELKLNDFRRSNNVYRISRTGGVLEVSVDGKVIFQKVDHRSIKYVNMLASRHHTSQTYGFGTLIFGPINMCYAGTK